jgi:hypothetical protein
LAQALAKLTECHALATGRTADGEASAGEPVAETAQPTEGQAEPQTEPQTPSARWEAARAKVRAQLQEVVDAVLASGDPDVGKAELELKFVQKQLSGTVATRQQAAEMERFLRDDDVVADISAMVFDLKTPLLEVLTAITPELST